MDYARIIQSIMHFPRLKWTDEKNKLPTPSISSISSLLLTSHFLRTRNRQIKITREISPELYIQNLMHELNLFHDVWTLCKLLSITRNLVKEAGREVKVGTSKSKSARGRRDEPGHHRGRQPGLAATARFRERQLRGCQGASSAVNI